MSIPLSWTAVLEQQRCCIGRYKHTLRCRVFASIVHTANRHTRTHAQEHAKIAFVCNYVKCNTCLSFYTYTTYIANTLSSRTLPKRWLNALKSFPASYDWLCSYLCWERRRNKKKINKHTLDRSMRKAIFIKSSLWSERAALTKVHKTRFMGVQHAIHTYRVIFVYEITILHKKKFYTQAHCVCV